MICKRPACSFNALLWRESEGRLKLWHFCLKSLTDWSVMYNFKDKLLVMSCVGRCVTEIDEKQSAVYEVISWTKRRSVAQLYSYTPARQSSKQIHDEMFAGKPLQVYHILFCNEYSNVINHSMFSFLPLKIHENHC